MTSKKTIFISDIHLGSGLKTDMFKPDRHQSNLVTLFDYILEDTTDTNELVLLGDIFEMWACPMNRKPPIFSDIYQHHPEIFEKLRNCVNKLDAVFFLNGNHDMHLTQTDLNGIGTQNKEIIHISNYNSGRLHGEHGHRFTMLNAQDKVHDPVHGYPLGYYISRMMAGEESYVSRGAVFSILDDILEACLTSQTFSESVIEALQEFLGLSPDDEFIMPGKRQPVTIKQIQKRYAGLFQKWIDKYGYLYSLEAIKGELKRLGWFADRISQKEGYKVVVFGHSHRPELDKDSIFVEEDRLYANTGYWCTDSPTFVEVKKKNQTYDVVLNSIRENRIQALDQKEV